ncbi:hypothetical protein C0995_006943 [Termitomyces sp. Mi166|nr:hypothetical protein C0995_006943 [Termitomyces sp. Mi166\
MSDKLFNIARSKLHVHPGARDSLSLHRWVLLKNSIISSVNTAPPDEPDELDADAFMFPDAGKLVAGQPPNDGGSSISEAQWLDSLLETLGGDDDDDDFSAVSHISMHVEDEDDNDDQLSLAGSPVSSSDDLLIQPPSLPPHHPITVPYPYPVPYPPFHPPLIYTYDLDPTSSFDSFSTVPPSSYDEPLPYYDVENSSVPDAIEDTSDDESTDALTTPSLGRSSNSLTLLDAASSSRSRLRHPRPHVHVEPDDPYFYPFELDPLPFPHEHQPYNNYQEC